MTPDFFQRQAERQTQSRRFFAIFAVSVVVAVAVFYLAITLCLSLTGATVRSGRLAVATGAAVRGGSYLEPAPADPAFLIESLPRSVYGDPPRVLAARPMSIIGLAIVAIIAGACFYKIRAIKNGGGFYVAVMLGGRLLEKAQTAREKQLVNVVEEMAVAAGLPRPEIFILDQEAAINAVTAGLTPDDAVIAVTAGALSHLNRDELQAVVAHEFAHIFNGDCALNLTMTGWLHGLLVFYIAGRNMLAVLSSKHRIRSHRVKFSAGVLGLILTVGGWLGKFFAELTQAALSRSREYLADAFAVQFTRNPAALAGALKKIAVCPKTLRSGQAAAMKTFFITSPTRGFSLFRSHPPLEDRIWAIDPNWDGNWPDLGMESPAEKEPAAGGENNPKAQELISAVRKQAAAGRGAAGQLKDWPLNWAGVSLLALAGDRAGPAPNLAEAGRRLYQNLPETLRAAAGDPAQAPALAAAVFIQSEEPEVEARQLEIIKKNSGPAAAEAAASFRRLMPAEARLPLLGLTAPVLRRRSPGDRAAFWELIKKLIAADGRLSLFEVAAAQILKKSLNLKLAGSPRPAPAGSLAARLKSDAALFLSALAHAGAEGQDGEEAREEAARAAFQEAQSRFADHWPPLAFASRRYIKIKDIPPLLDRLGQAPEKIKGRLAAAAVACALHDGVITPKEYELTRALAAALDFNLPLQA